MQEILFKNLFNKNLKDTDSRVFLQDSANEFPYFGALHYFLLKETGANHTDYRTIASKTALHFNNPFLLHFQIHQERNPTKTGIKIEIDESLIQKAETTETLLTRKHIQEEKEKEELLFEPLFTSDYFAAQGIKLSEEVAPNDQLGKQLKSFTAWLKTMKKVHGSNPPTSANVDVQVEKMAENSNQNTEIITEAMADIYMKQGKLDKAEAIFHKLSLQNPSKSVYFADKIEQLKAI